EVWDSPNSAGVVIDAVRCAQLALDRGVGGALTGPSSYFMKSPPQQFTDHIARQLTLDFIAGKASQDQTQDQTHDQRARARAPRHVRAHG
ncbi:MAG TPA: hypothetical protein VNR40_21075, partial [Steroidobacter sp.]|nr:hypothetical protein [Steroidobacter sp.]